jgi:hypothetical protein
LMLRQTPSWSIQFVGEESSSWYGVQDGGVLWGCAQAAGASSKATRVMMDRRMGILATGTRT